MESEIPSARKLIYPVRPESPRESALRERLEQLRREQDHPYVEGKDNRLGFASGRYPTWDNYYCAFQV